VTDDPQPQYSEERVRENSPEEEAVMRTYEAQGWEFILKVDDAVRRGYVVLHFKRRG
jgi:hypothetical protein